LTSPAHGLIHVVNSAEELARHSDALNCDLLVDAVVGTGFNPPLKGLTLAVLDWVKAGRESDPSHPSDKNKNLARVGHPAPVLAVDLPSGWPADEIGATAPGPVFPADAVITFTAPKPAHLFGQLSRPSARRMRRLSRI
jgi:NAD(P)H-hydrate epimerase